MSVAKKYSIKKLFRKVSQLNTYSLRELYPLLSGTETIPCTKEAFVYSLW